MHVNSMKRELQMKSYLRMLSTVLLLAAGCLPLLCAVAQAQSPVFQVEGTYQDKENDVIIDLYMEPLSKFESYAFSSDPSSATDPGRIMADAAVSLDPMLPNEDRTFLMVQGIERPAGSGTFEAVLDVTPLGAQNFLETGVGYIVLAVYTDNVPRSTDGVTAPAVQYYGTHSPGVFVFDEEVAPWTPTPSPTPTPPGPSPTPLPFGLVVEADVDETTERPTDPVLDMNDLVDLSWVSAQVTMDSTITLYYDRDNYLQVFDSGGNFVQTVVAGASTELPLGSRIVNNGVEGVDFGTIDLTVDARFPSGYIPAELYPEEGFRWDFSDVPVGRYYFYGILDDPVKGVVVDYSTLTLDIRGNPRWPVLLGGSVDDRFVHGVAVDDVVPSATELDVVAVAQSGLLQVFDHLGRSWSTYDLDLDVTIDTSPVTGDVDGDGDIEIILGTNQVSSDGNPIFAERNALLAIDGDFKPRYQQLRAAGVVPDATLLQEVGLLNAIYYLPPGHSVFNTPAIEDLDGDGALEVIYTSRTYDSEITSLVEVLSFSSNPDIPPVAEASISPWRLVKKNKVLISELQIAAEADEQGVTTGGQDTVEFTNVSGDTVEVTNWSIMLYDEASWPDPMYTVSLNDPNNPEARYFLEDEGTFTITENCTGGSFPNLCLRSGSKVLANPELDWRTTSTTIAVMVRDNRGNIVDFVTTGDRSLITKPVSVPASQWSSAGLFVPAEGGATHQRIGSQDTNRNTDWTNTQAASLGAVNTHLVLPFSHGTAVLGPPAVGNVDEDEALEVVFGTSIGDVYVIEPYSFPLGDTPVLVPIHEIDDPTLANPSILRSPALVDSDGDDIEEILVAVSERDGALQDRGQLLFLRGNGDAVLGQALIFESTREYSSQSAPTAGRLSSDPGAPVVALFTTRNALVGIDLSNGNRIFNQSFPGTNQAFASSSPVLGQAQPQDVSEAFELFIGGGGGTSGNLFGWYFDPAQNKLIDVEGIVGHGEPVLPGFLKPAAILGSPVLADLDLNLQTDVMYTNEAGYVNRFEMSLPAKNTVDPVLVPSDFPWPALKHDHRGTASSAANPVPVAPYRAGDVNRDGVIDENDLFTIAKKWSERDGFKRKSGVSDLPWKADDGLGMPQSVLLRVLSGMKN